MSRQIQFRRGTAANHETFTGACGEITVDTTNNTLRVHDGQTAGGTVLAKKSELPDLSQVDNVIASQIPSTANGNTWYRKYNSGWVEQGGYVSGALDATITMPVPMQNTNYACGVSSVFTTSSNNGACTFGIKSGSKTKTTFIVAHNGYLEWKPAGFEWIVRGFSE